MPVDESESQIPFGVEAAVHQLELRDVFEFLATPLETGAGKLPRGKLTVTVRPWGPRSQATGPVGPWMFACRDAIGVEHHLSLPPRMRIRILERRCR